MLSKAIDSLILCVEIFNRPYDRGRQTATLIFLDHSFEMLLKASILQRGGKIKENNSKHTIGFDACVRLSLSNGKIKFLSDDQALLLQSINSLRDAAQHHILDISEGQLYLQTQGGLTLFRDILRTVFKQELALELPKRVLPIATEIPMDLQTLFEVEIEEVKQLLRPGRRKQTEASARLRPLAILDAAMKGEKGLPGTKKLKEIKQEILTNKPWTEIFQGVASVQTVTEGTGAKIELRLNKKDGIPVQIVPEGTPGASVIGVKRVNELDFYSLGLKQLAQKIGITQPRALALIHKLGIQHDLEYFKIIKVSSQEYKRYSPKALQKIQEHLPHLDMKEVWDEYQRQKREKK